MTLDQFVQIALNNGFMALFAVWVLFRGEPKYREAMTTINAKNAALIKSLSEDNRNTLDAMRQAFSSTIDVVTSKFEALIQSLHKECREERIDVLNRMLANEEKDREARHKQADVFQRTIAEMHEAYMSRIDHRPAHQPKSGQ